MACKICNSSQSSNDHVYLKSCQLDSFLINIMRKRWQLTYLTCWYNTFVFLQYLPLQYNICLYQLKHDTWTIPWLCLEPHNTWLRLDKCCALRLMQKMSDLSQKTWHGFFLFFLRGLTQYCPQLIELCSLNLTPCTLYAHHPPDPLCCAVNKRIASLSWEKCQIIQAVVTPKNVINQQGTHVGCHTHTHILQTIHTSP